MPYVRSRLICVKELGSTDDAVHDGDGDGDGWEAAMSPGQIRGAVCWRYILLIMHVISFSFFGENSKVFGAF